MKTNNTKPSEGIDVSETPEALVRRMFKGIGINPEQEQVDGIVKLAKDLCVASVYYPDDSDIKSQIINVFKFLGDLNDPPDLKPIVDSITKP
jgi:hypothetical protein